MKYRSSILTLAIAGTFAALPALADNPNNPKSPDSPYAGTVPVVTTYTPQDSTAQTPAPQAANPNVALTLREQRLQYHHGITHDPDPSFAPGVVDAKDAPN